MPRVKDLTGQRFGKLVVLYQQGLDSRRSADWFCKCDCGNTCVVSSRRIMYLKHVSCGCVKGINERRKPLSNMSARCAAYDGVRRGARKRGYLFSITREQFEDLSSQDCFYCGAHPSNKARKDGQEYCYNGLDRVDNGIGYEIGNVVPCCSVCNVAKNSHSKEEFFSWIRRVYGRIQ